MAKISDRQTESLLTSLHRLEFILQHKSDQLLRLNLGLGFGQLRILEGLSATRACSQRVLARQLYQTEANISRQLRLLQKDGYVEIIKHPKDKRQRRVKLTGDGADICKRAKGLLAGLHKEILASVDFRDAFNLTQTAQQLAQKLI